jgi:predicted ATPase
VAEVQPQILAHHLTEAGILEKAVEYWCRAGQQSAKKSALIEAIAQLRRGLRLIANLPDTRECKQQELDLLVTLAGALMGVRGYAHPEVAEAFGRARSLVLEMEGAGTTPHFSVLYGLWVADFVGGKPKASLERAEEFLLFAQSLKETGLLVKGHQLVGTTLLSIGDYAAAFPHLESAVAFCAPDAHRTLAIRFAADIDVAALCNWAWALWHRGYPDQASNAAHQALQHAQQSAHVPTLAYALIHLGIKAAFERCAAETGERANEALALAREHGLAMWSGYGLMLQGWALSQRGQGETAVEQIRSGLTATRETAARNFEPLFLGLLAEAFALAGEIEDGLVVLSEAFATADASGQKGTDAELHRLRGDLLHRLPSPDCTQVEISYRTALSIAREQGTRGFELRAAVSLARLLTDKGRREEARDLLTPVYGWFTEGFDAPDLKEAEALLEALDA